MERSPRVSQASGVVSVQADCTRAEALAMMKDRALAAHMTLLEIAELVIRHRI